MSRRWRHTIEILKGLRDCYEAHHRVTITDAALVAAATLADRYISDRYLPDKAIDLIDEAGARICIRSSARQDVRDIPDMAPPDVRDIVPPDLRAFDERIAQVRRDKDSAIDVQDFERAAQLRDEQRQLLGQRAQRDRAWKAGDLDVVSEVDDEQIAEVLAAWTGIPVRKVTEEETARLLRMEGEMHRRIVGQQEAVTAVARAVRRGRAGLKDPKRPSGSFIFAGPSGVGKTELSKALAEFLFGSEDALVQLDMSEFHDQHTVSRLVGAPPGYVGHDEGGQLTEHVRRRPFSVVLFDEIEKAHPDVSHMLLQILEDGRLTDGKGRTVDFKNTIIIATTNLGTSGAKALSAGFQPSDDAAFTHQRVTANVDRELRRYFRPELLNRVDDTIVFHQLTETEILSIVELMISRIESRLRTDDIGLELTVNAKRFLATTGYDPAQGARPLRRTIQREIEDPLSDRLLCGGLQPGQIVLIESEGDPADVANARLVFSGMDKVHKPAKVPDAVRAGGSITE